MYSLPTIPRLAYSVKFKYCLGKIPAHAKAWTSLTKVKSIVIMPHLFKQKSMRHATGTSSLLVDQGTCSILQKIVILSMSAWTFGTFASEIMHGVHALSTKDTDCTCVLMTLKCYKVYALTIHVPAPLTQAPTEQNANSHKGEPSLARQ